MAGTKASTGLKKKYYGLEDYSNDSTALSWLKRAEKMKVRRSYYEEMWRRNIFSFVAHAVYENDGAKKQFDPDVAPELQGYVSSRLRTSGFKFTDIRYPLEFAVIMRKMATEIKNIPPAEWKIKGEDDQSPALLFKNIYNEIMTEESESEFETFELWLGKNVFGTSIAWSRMIQYDRTNKEPYYDEDTKEMDYKEEEVTVRKFKTENMDLRHVLIDDGCRKASLTDAEDCICFEYLTEERAKEVYSDVKFDELGIKPAKRNEVFQDINDRYGGDQKDFYEVMHCYNWVTDNYDILMNGKTVRQSPIPQRTYRGEKELPITLFTDHTIPGSPYGFGEPAILKAFREIKNKNRNLIYDVTKKGAKPTIAIDPLSTFDEESYFWGQDFLRVAPGDMQPIPVQMNLEPALNLDERTDEDTIIVSGVNIKDTASSGSNESATRTVVRKESQVAVIDLGLHFNSITGLKRWHRINANIILLNLLTPEFGDQDDDGLREVQTEGRKIFKSRLEENDKFLEEEQQGTFTFKYKGEDVVNYQFMPILKIGNVAISEQLEKNLKLEGLETLVTVAPEAMNQEAAGEVIRDMFNFPKNLINKQEAGPAAPETSEEDMVEELIRQAGGVVPEENNITNDYKNAQKDQVVAEDAASPAKMGAGGEAVGVPAA